MLIKFVTFNSAGKTFGVAKKEAKQFKCTVLEIIIG